VKSWKKRLRCLPTGPLAGEASPDIAAKPLQRPPGSQFPEKLGDNHRQMVIVCYGYRSLCCCWTCIIELRLVREVQSGWRGFQGYFSGIRDATPTQEMSSSSGSINENIDMMIDVAF
jgi:hypothetical protein